MFPLCPGKGLCPTAAAPFDTSCARVRYPALEQFHSGLNLYFNQGIRPGAFLTAVLANDLQGAVARADPGARELLPQLVELIYNHAPSIAWGSAQAFDAWRERCRAAHPAADEATP